MSLVMSCNDCKHIYRNYKKNKGVDISPFKLITNDWLWYRTIATDVNSLDIFLSKGYTRLVK